MQAELVTVWNQADETAAIKATQRRPPTSAVEAGRQSTGAGRQQLWAALLSAPDAAWTYATLCEASGVNLKTARAIVAGWSRGGIVRLHVVGRQGGRYYREIRLTQGARHYKEIGVPRVRRRGQARRGRA